MNSDSVDESLSTIRFAERARHIMTSIKANTFSATDNKLIKNLLNEIKYLKDILNIRTKGRSKHQDISKHLLRLKKENNRLREMHVSKEKVEELIEQNRMMKL